MHVTHLWRQARRHVNRLCLASGRALVESGTAGYLGQVRRAHCTAQQHTPVSS